MEKGAPVPRAEGAPFPRQAGGNNKKGGISMHNNEEYERLFEKFDKTKDLIHWQSCFTTEILQRLQKVRLIC